MKLSIKAALILGAVIMVPTTASIAMPSAPSAEQQKQYVAQIAQMESSLKKRNGDIAVPEAKVVMHLGNEYYYLDKADARKVIVDIWGNPPGEADNILGMVFPANSKLSDASTWGAVLTFEPTGYVKDDDALSTDYDEIMTSMQEAEPELNGERQKQGFETIHLVGWAERPTYDSKAHSMVWARNIKFGMSPENSLNYDMRLLGRYGVFSMNMITGMSQLAQAKTAAAKLASSVTFDTGARYADFNESTDTVAEYGVGGLVAAGVGLAAAKKLGFLGLILAFGKKFLVLILAGVALLGGAVKRFFSKGEDLMPEMEQPNRE